MDIDKSKEPITFEEVKYKLKNKELEAYSKQDVFERYIVYGSEEELNNPTIQRLKKLCKYSLLIIMSNCPSPFDMIFLS